MKTRLRYIEVGSDTLYNNHHQAPTSYHTPNKNRCACARTF